MNKKYSEEWFNKANKDYKTAVKLFELKDCDLYENIAFHCQQCAEKYLKGFLAYHNKETEKTHSIEKLLKQCQKIEDFSVFNDLIDLTDFAVSFRYPSEPIDLTSQDIIKYINDIEKLMNYIEDLLPLE